MTYLIRFRAHLSSLKTQSNYTKNLPYVSKNNSILTQLLALLFQKHGIQFCRSWGLKTNVLVIYYNTVPVIFLMSVIKSIKLRSKITFLKKIFFAGKYEAAVNCVIFYNLYTFHTYCNMSPIYQCYISY